MPGVSHLLAMSFDSASSPAIKLSGDEGMAHDAQFTGWGFAWYPTDDFGAVVIKDPMPTGEATAMTRLLRDWDRFRSTAFLCHLRGAAQRATQQDTHPFSRSYAGRDWLFAQAGQLRPGWADALPVSEDPVFEPVGRTDSEHAFCWLLLELRRRQARALADVGWRELHALLREINGHGPANLLITDGQDLVAYRDMEAQHDLHYIRRVPPHKETTLAASDVSLSLNHPLDLNRSMVIVSSQPLSEEGWTQLEPGHMLVTRRGAIAWASTARDPVPTLAPVPAPPVPAPTPNPPAPVEIASEPFGAPVPPPTASSPYAQVTEQNPAAVAARGGHPAPDTDDALAPLPAARPVSDNRLDPLEEAPDLDAPSMHTGRASRVMTVYHETRYTYKEPVQRSTHLFRLQPVNDTDQQLLDHDFQITPDRRSRNFEDVFGNRAKRFKIESPYEELRLVARSRVRVFEPAPLSSPARRSTIPLVWMPWQRQMMTPYLLPPELPESQLRELSEFAMSFAERQDFNLVETLVDMNQTLYRDFSYVSGSTTLATTPFDVYVSRRGVCQDFANLFICMARLLGVPARYRVGYIHTGADYENTIQSEASHAWAELYLPWVGWRGFDPTNGILAGTDHIRVAGGRNYRDATPTSGTIFAGGGGERLSVEVRVEVETDASDRTAAVQPA